MTALVASIVLAAGPFYLGPPSGVGGGGELMADVAYCAAPTSDAAASACALRGASAYPAATVNTTGGVLYIGGGEGVMKVAVTKANCTGNYVSISCNGASATQLAYGTDWCATACASDTAAATSLASAIEVLSGTTATSSTGTVYLLPDSTCVDVAIATDDATCAAITDGSNAGVKVRGALTAAVGLDVQGGMITEGDGTYSWGHSPTGIGTEGILEVDGVAYFDGGATLDDVLVQKAVAFAADDATPAIDGGNLFTTVANSGPLALTDLDLGTAGQVVTICGTSNTNSPTIADAGNFSLNGAMTLGSGSCITLYVVADNNYYELSRNNQSTDLVSDLTPQLGGDLDTQGYDISNGVALTGDSASNVNAMIQMGTNASPFATTAARQIGGATVLAAGIGTAGCSAVAGAACAGDTVTVSGTDQAGTAFSAILTDGGNWTHSDTAATNATNLASAITAHASLSPYVTASAVSTAVGVAAIAGKVSSLTIATSDAACCTVVNGADGVLLSTAGPGPDTVWNLSALQIGVSGPKLASHASYGLASRNSAGNAYANFYAGYVELSSTISTTGVLSTGSVQANTDYYHGDDFLPSVSAVATDAAPVQTVVTTEEPYSNPSATDATYTTGGNLVLAPANGSRRLAGAGNTDMCGGAACTANTGTTIITIPTYTNGTLTNCTITEGAATAAGVMHCDGHTAAECAASIKTAMSVSPCSLLTTSVATNGVLAVTRVNGSVEYIGTIVVTVGGGSNITAETAGVDGSVVVPGGTAVNPGLKFGTSGSGFFLNGTAIKVGLAGADSNIQFSTNQIYVGSSATTYLSSTMLAAPGVQATTYTQDVSLYLTDATATASNKGYLRTATAKYAFTTTIIAAAAGVGDDTVSIKAVTLPLKTEVVDAMFVVDVAETHLTDLTVSCGRTGGDYIDYIKAGSAQTQQLLGDAAGERGTNLTGYDVPGYAWGASATDVYCQFITTDAGHDLNDVVAFSGWLAITTRLLP